MADGWDDVDFSGWQLSHFLSRMPFIDSAGLPLILGEPHTTVHRTLVDLPADGIDFRRERERGSRTAPLREHEIREDIGGVIPVYRKTRQVASCSSGGSVAEVGV